MVSVRMWVHDLGGVSRVYNGGLYFLGMVSFTHCGHLTLMGYSGYLFGYCTLLAWYLTLKGYVGYLSEGFTVFAWLL